MVPTSPKTPQGSLKEEECEKARSTGAPAVSSRRLNNFLTSPAYSNAGSAYRYGIVALCMATQAEQR